MAEESDLEKTEPGSPRRLEKAREEGEIARSRELTTFLLLATGIGGLWMTAAPMSEHMSSALQHGLRFERASAFDPSHMLVQAGTIVLEGLQALLPLLGLMALAALVGPLMLGGGCLRQTC